MWIAACAFTWGMCDLEGILMEEKLIGTGVKFERIRRITGYLVGTLERFNNAKRAEERDRIKHTSFRKG